nr:uncharacterized mitochondrial protein AtMg00810-like [Tanacetum cinerariifolium]
RDCACHRGVRDYLILFFGFDQGKFDGKADKGFLIGDSVSRIGPTWLFDIDTLTKSMNYQLVTAGNQPNPSEGIQEHFDAEKAGDGNVQQYVLFSLWSSGSKDPQNTDDDATFKVKDPKFEVEKPKSEVHVSPSNKFEDCFDNSINKFNAASTLVSAVGQILTNNTNTFSVVGPSNTADSPTHGKSSYVDTSQYPDDPNMPALEDITYSDDEEDVGAEADFSNIETTITVNPIPTTRVHKDHPVTQIIGDLSSATQTRGMTRMVKDQGGLTQINNEDFHTCMFACFLSEKEPKRVHQVLKDPSWIKAIQEEILQFKMQKQAPRAWYETLANYLLENGFQRGKIEQTLFIKKQKGNILLVQVYVDDIIFGSTNKGLCKAFENLMKDKFQMSSMGEVTFFLGLQVKQKQDGIFISQDKYVAKILRKFRLTVGKSVSTPIDTEKPLLKDPDGKDVDVHTYRSMIGSLMNLTSSRPDIMVVVCACARFQVTPKASHLHAVKRIFRYLKGKPHLGLWYPKDSPFNLVAYLDSDYAGASLDRKSTTGGCQFFGCRLISWQCKKQTVVATSSIEAEYVATQAADDVDDVVADNVLADDVADVVVDDVIADVVAHAAAEPTPPSPTPTTTPPPPQQEVTSTPPPSPHQSPVAPPSSPPEQPQPLQTTTISMDLLNNLLKTCTTLTKRVKNLEIKSSADTVMDNQEDVFEQGGIIAKIDADKDVILEEVDAAKDADVEKNEDVQGRLEECQAQVYHIDLEHADKVLSMQDDELEPAELKEVIEVVTTAKLMIEVVTAATTTITAAPSAARKRKEIVIRDHKKIATPSTIQAQIEQDEAYERELEAELNKNINWDGVIEQATPLALKVPVVDYEIHTKNNKHYYKIIRADGTHHLFLSFLSLLRNFNREDLEVLWQIVKEKFTSSKPKSLSDDLTTLKMILLVERRYPLKIFTLDQMLNNVRLEVEEESEVSLELLRFGHGNQKNQDRGIAFMLEAEEARQDPNIMPSTFALNDHFATTLFNSGADYSFVSTTFIPLLGIEPSELGFRYKIEIASGHLVEIDKVIKNCKIEIKGHVFDIDLIPFGHRSFDEIIGMDWLSNYKAEIICHAKVVGIPLPDGKVLRVLGERPEEKVRFLMSAKTDDKKQEEIVVVRDFLE